MPLRLRCTDTSTWVLILTLTAALVVLLLNTPATPTTPQDVEQLKQVGAAELEFYRANRQFASTAGEVAALIDHSYVYLPSFRPSAVGHEVSLGVYSGGQRLTVTSRAGSNRCDVVSVFASTGEQVHDWVSVDDRNSFCSAEWADVWVVTPQLLQR